MDKIKRYNGFLEKLQEDDLLKEYHDEENKYDKLNSLLYDVIEELSTTEDGMYIMADKQDEIAESILDNKDEFKQNLKSLIVQNFWCD